MGKKWLNERSKEDCMMSEKEETEKKAVCESKEMREALIIIALYVFCRMEDPVCISFSLSLDVRPSFSWCNFAGESFTGLFMRPKRWWSLYLLSLSLHVFFSAVAPHFSFSTSFTFSFSPQVLIMTKMKKNKRRQRTRREMTDSLAFSFHLRWKNPSLRILIDHTLLWFPLFFSLVVHVFSLLLPPQLHHHQTLSLFFFLFVFPNSFLFNYFPSLTSRSWDTHTGLFICNFSLSLLLPLRERERKRERSRQTRETKGREILFFLASFDWVPVIFVSLSLAWKE